MKMKSDYTLFNQSSIQNYSSIDNVDLAVEYLKDPTHFRSFGQGLTELLQKKNAPVDFSDNAEKTRQFPHRLAAWQNTVHIF